MKKLKVPSLIISMITLCFICTSCCSSSLKPLEERDGYLELDGWMAFESDSDTYVTIIGYKKTDDSITELVLPVKLNAWEVLIIDGSLSRQNYYDIPDKLFVPAHSYWFHNTSPIFPDATKKMIFNATDPSIHRGGFRHPGNPDSNNAPYQFSDSKKIVPKISLDAYKALFKERSYQFQAANVSYYYNYEDSPNDGFCWIDDLDIGESIKTIPKEPLRKGYKFAGWYEKDQTEPFDFTTYVKGESELELFAHWSNQL